MKIQAAQETRPFRLSQNFLQQLHHLDRSSSRFHDQLNDVLYGGEYRMYLPNLQDDDLAWLVDYLDEVRCRIVFPHSLLKPT